MCRTVKLNGVDSPDWTGGVGSLDGIGVAETHRANNNQRHITGVDKVMGAISFTTAGPKNKIK